MVQHFRTKTVLILFSLLLAGISTYAQAWANAQQDMIVKSDSVYLVTRNDDFNLDAGKIDDFAVSSDFNAGWQRNKERIEGRARDKGANVVLLTFFGWDKHGHTFYARGSLYHAEASQIDKMLSARRARESECAMVIFRDNGASLATYTYDVTIDGEQYKYFNDMTHIRKLMDCNGTAQIKFRKQPQSIQLNGHTRYFRLSKDAGAGGALGVGGEVLIAALSGTALVEIKDPELGRLLSGQTKLYGIRE